MAKRRVMFSGSSIGKNAFWEIGEILDLYGTRALVVGGLTGLESVREKMEQALWGSSVVAATVWNEGNCTAANTGKLVMAAREQGADMIIGVGGGKAIDAAKVVGCTLKLPVFAIPTLGGGCAAGTRYAYLFGENGRVESAVDVKRPPVHIFLDSEVLSKGPYEYMRAGMGEGLGLYFDMVLISRGIALDFHSRKAVELGRLGVAVSLECGKHALEDYKWGTPSDAFEQVVLNNVVNQGQILSLLEDTYAYGLSAALAEAFLAEDTVENKYLPGDYRAYGALVLMAIDSQLNEAKSLLPFYREVGLPTTLKELGYEGQEEALTFVLERAVGNPRLAYLPYTVTKEMIGKGMKRLALLQGDE